MSRAAKIEALRANLAAEAEAKDWEWKFVSDILSIAKEMGRSPDEILDWSIMRYDIARRFIQEYYDKLALAMKGESAETGPITLG